MRPFALFLLPVAVGCYSEERFAESATAAFCNRTFECAEGDSSELDLLDLVYRWDNAHECILDVDSDDWINHNPDCTYDASLARECVKSIRTEDCDDRLLGLIIPSTVCDHVYDCD